MRNNMSVEVCVPWQRTRPFDSFVESILSIRTTLTWCCRHQERRIRAEKSILGIFDFLRSLSVITFAKLCIVCIKAIWWRDYGRGACYKSGTHSSGLAGVIFRE